MNTYKFKNGFTLVETLVSVAIFSILIAVVYKTSALLISQGVVYRQNTTVSSLADQYMEIARNLPYSQIGTLNGSPHGNLPDLPNAKNVNVNGTVYKVYYVVNYIDDPADGTIALGTDSSPNDYKQIKLYINNTSTGLTKSFLGNIVPKGLENINNAGALSVQVIDAVGQPVSGASINIVNNTGTTSINLTRTSDVYGNWIEVGLPDSANSYHIVVTKNGYSTDQTYPSSVGNPNPTKPDATILNGQVTKISFSIDKLSSLGFKTLDQTCNVLSGIGMGIQGSKIIGTPNVFKFTNSYTSDGNGLISIPTLEWDNYIPGIAGNTYMIYGSSPIQQMSILPNTSQNFSLVLGPKTTNSLLVIVKDNATGNPIEGANVNLEKASVSLGDKLTGGSSFVQNDWSGGAGQNDWINQNMYSEDDGNISVNIIPLAIRLRNQTPSTYVTSDSLTSSTFDTGATTTIFTTLSWLPTSQDPSTNIKFQVATNNDKTTWNFVGPDGTAGTYYTVSGTTINTSNNGNQYLRYKVFLSTNDETKTPVLTSVIVNYVSGCFTPGQVIFTGIEASKDYIVTVSKSGFTDNVISGINVSGYGVLSVSL
ncbi:MAG: prepilin-type N-terminal cleavage/methylation domain-containing protein [bacterium]